MAVVPLGPAVVDFTGVRAGDLNMVTATIKRAGTPVDLTGSVVAAQARLESITPDPPALTAEVLITDAAGGALSIRWPGDDVRTLLAGEEQWSGVWDLQIGNGTDDPVTVAAGKFVAVMDVTRP